MKNQYVLIIAFNLLAVCNSFSQIVTITSGNQLVSKPVQNSGHGGRIGIGSLNTNQAQSPDSWYFLPQRPLHIKQFVPDRRVNQLSEVPSIRFTPIISSGQNFNPGGGGVIKGEPDRGPNNNNRSSSFLLSDHNDWFESQQHHWDLEARTSGFSLIHTPFGSASTNRFHITSTGNVGIAEASPSSRLVIRGANNTATTTINSVLSLNGQSGIGIGMNSISAIGSASNQNIYINSKGTGAVAVGVPIGQSTKGAFQVVGSTVIGTKIPTSHPDFKLAVEGKIIASEIVVVPPSSVNGVWADYVFDSAYRLRPLDELKVFVEKNKHLPDMPKESDVERNGVDLFTMNRDLLKKIEELTLYLFEQENRIKALESKLKQ